MHLAKISDGGAALELLGGEFVDGREDGRHGDVYPDIDRSQFVLHPIGGLFDGLRVCHISRDRQSPHTEAPQFGGRAFKPVRVARQQGHLAAVPSKLGGSSAADAGSGPCNHHDLRHLHSFR